MAFWIRGPSSPAGLLSGVTMLCAGSPRTGTSGAPDVPGRGTVPLR